jgi:hypothetical protein
VFNRSPLLDKEWAQKIILFTEPGKKKGMNDRKISGDTFVFQHRNVALSTDEHR